MSTRRLLTPLYVLAILGLCLTLLEPSFAGNKFETIGGGVAGSSRVKAEYLFYILLGAGGLSLLAAVASVMLPHDNPLILNFSTWKQSAIAWAVMAAILIGGALMI